LVTAVVGTTRRATLYFCAIGAKEVANDSSSGPMGMARTSALTAPASSLAMSSKASSSASTEARPSSTLATNSSCGCRSPKVATNKRAACKGCSRSWLAAAMKRVLSILASSALARAASNSAVRWATRRSSDSFTLRKAVSARRRSVMST
jgi:hypothetical protein